MSRTRSSLGGLCSFVNVHGEESLRRRVGPERSQVERQTIRMYERQEEAWRPLTRQCVAAFIRLFLLCMVYVENGRAHPHPVTAKLLKKTLVKRVVPFIHRRLVWTMDESMWPITMEQFEELDHHLVTHLPTIHVGHRWRDIGYFYKEIERVRDEWRRFDDMEREVMQAVQRYLGH